MTNKEKYFLVKQAGLKDKLFGLFARKAIPRFANQGHRLLQKGGNPLTRTLGKAKLPWYLGGRFSSTILNDLNAIITNRGAALSTGRGFRFNPFTLLNPNRYPNLPKALRMGMAPLHYAGSRLGTHTPLGRIALTGIFAQQANNLYGSLPGHVADQIANSLKIKDPKFKKGLEEKLAPHTLPLLGQMTLPFLNPFNYFETNEDNVDKASLQELADPRNFNKWFRSNTKRNPEFEQAKALWKGLYEAPVESQETIVPSAGGAAQGLAAGPWGTGRRIASYALANILTQPADSKTPYKERFNQFLKEFIAGPGMNYAGGYSPDGAHGGRVSHFNKDDLTTPLGLALADSGNYLKDYFTTEQLGLTDAGKERLSKEVKKLKKPIIKLFNEKLTEGVPPR